MHAFSSELAVAANVSQVLTAAIALAAATWAFKRALDRRRSLEQYLRSQREKDLEIGRHGLRTALHLSSRLGITVGEVHAAAFGSRKIRRCEVADEETGKVTEIAFQWRPFADRRAVWTTWSRRIRFRP